MLLGVLADVVERFNWRCHAYCLMGRADRDLTVVLPLSRWSIRGERPLTGDRPDSPTSSRPGAVLYDRFAQIPLRNSDPAYFFPLSRVARTITKAKIVDSGAIVKVAFLGEKDLSTPERVFQQNPQKPVAGKPRR